AHDFGVHCVSKALGVNYERLKGRTSGGTVGRRRSSSRRPKFVEVRTAPPVFSSPCIVELESPSGVRMRISLQGTVDADLVALTTAFVSAER
ncbi:hypothetical protein JXA88_14865, partial [Candidatus Fermentibacteria bacterium]|nr:hypothetical protein [Candidatus Fermentibacteria bacterium]